MGKINLNNLDQYKDQYSQRPQKIKRRKNKSTQEDNITKDKK